MCIILTRSQPKSTHLFNIPCTLNNIDYQMLIYTNDLPLSRKYRTYNYDNGLMIVVIPNIIHNCEFGLVDITTRDIRYFRQQLKETCISKMKSILPRVDMMDSTTRCKCLKKVYNIGNYDISIADDLDELRNNINWEHFSLPNDFETRMDTFNDKTIFHHSYSYVVAKATKNIRNDGFGILFPDPGYTYFPTCHEKSNHSNIKSYDVKCYEFGIKPILQFPFKTNKETSFTINGFKDIERVDENFIPSYPLNINEFEKDILNKLPTFCISSKTGEELDIKLKKITHVNFCPIKTTGINQNIELVNPQTNTVSNVITGV